MISFIKILVGILAIVNPLGAIPVFLSLCGEQSPKEASAIARVAALSVNLVLLVSTRIGKRLGITGLNIATRIMGLLLSAIEIQMIAEGLKQLFPGLS
ncbi:MAG TPA: hypothetical protein ENK33_13480 [Desulfobacterales bacterium]|nr:hypothetical protein [Desulfobacterales bacterium]